MSRRPALFLAALLALAPVAAYAQTQPAPACPAPTPTPTPVPTPPQELAVALAELNKFRADNGVAALTLDAKLTLAAQGHAADMASNGYFSHQGRDGSSVGTRVTRAGYAFRAVGENISYGYRTWTASLEGWKSSAGHRRNMLNSTYRHVGLGRAVNASGRPYYVQVFAAPR